MWRKMSLLLLYTSVLFQNLSQYFELERVEMRLAEKVGNWFGAYSFTANSAIRELQINFDSKEGHSLEC